MTAIGAAGGCSSEAPSIPEPQIDRLGIISTAYVDAATQLKRPPQNLDEVKAALPAGTNADDVFRSPRDGEPYVIVYGVDPRGPIESDLPPLIAYEKTGSGGVRYAVTVMGITELTEEQFQAYGPPAQASGPTGK